MPKGSSKSTITIQRLLEERRQYEAWITRLSAAEDATPEGVRVRVKADYEARLRAVTEELKTHAESARQTIELRRHFRAELQKKEAHAAEKLAETELRHAVGEYDEAQWSQVHKDALAELVSVREELQAVDADIEKLEELDGLVRAAPRSSPVAKEPSSGGAASPPARSREPREQLDELAFIKSVTEDEKSGAPSPKRASGGHYQPSIPMTNPSQDPTPPPASPRPAPRNSGDEPRTLKCKACGTMNLPTEWYCESCGAELAAL
jgi:hypothetical protein